MALLKTLHTQLGLSQSAFSGLLNCSPGQLSMAESGLRSLPPASLAVVTELQKAITATKVARQVSNTPDEETAALLNRHIHKSGVQVESMEIIASRLREKLEAAEQMLSVSAAITASSLGTSLIVTAVFFIFKKW